MTAVVLPLLPQVWRHETRLIVFNAVLKPSLGGPAQRPQRVGTRWGVTIEIPALGGEQAEALHAAMMKAQSLGQTVILPFPQRPMPSVGFPLVNGASQAGSTLAIDALASRTVKAGRFFNYLNAAGRSFLHQVSDDAVVSSAGVATLSITPLIRSSPADNAPVNFAVPKIEGFLDEACNRLTVDMMAWSSFTLDIEEIE